ncbi:MAG TPA: (2Fe-2S)-binding protein [Anaeromyxobacter sp.]|nr:(2Fe-2S)-binding protein [Anaeromyxobacter sp.]
MKICVCRDVSDGLLRDAVRCGRTVEDVIAATGAGSDCGACEGALARIAAAARTERVTLRSPAGAKAA